MSGGQLAPLIALRWRMLRTRRARAGFGALAASVPLLGLAAVLVGLFAPGRGSFDIIVLAPTAYASVAVLALLAPLVAGGGNELYPEEHLVAYPVSARTQYLASLVLTPLNLAWTTQLVGLVGLTAYIAPQRGLAVFALVTCVSYVAMVTVTAQSLAWLVVGIRQRRAGRIATWILAGLIVSAVLVTVLLGQVTAAVELAPTTSVVIGAVNGASGGWSSWAVTTGILLGLTFVVWHLGRAACVWALRQPGGAARAIDAHPVTRRRQHGVARRDLLATDRASVWRSSSLRRGLIVLAVLPGSVAAGARLDWPSLILLPGLVAAGAGLLFGVNVFCLDGRGAIWLAAQPHPPGVQFWCKTRVVAEVCAGAVAVTILAGALRSGRWPTPAELAAILSCSAVVVARVVAVCMELSVLHPHRADLRGPRDTPAPPGVMAAYSARLAVSTTLLGVLFSGLSELESWQWPAAVAVPLVLLSVRRIVRCARLWRSATVRSRVATTVAIG